ncbi:MAG TPA: hypothetical protein VK518_00340, partial [Puia sp.]|nr:hypothetical protein [Puia sp.]
MRPAKLLLTALTVLVLFSCHSKEAADLLIYHCKVYTVDSAFSTAEAVVVRDGKILATGTDDAIRSKYSAKETIDAGGAMYVYPGFIDAHAHFVRYGQSLFTAALY